MEVPEIILKRTLVLSPSSRDGLVLGGQAANMFTPVLEYKSDD